MLACLCAKIIKLSAGSRKNLITSRGRIIKKLVNFKRARIEGIDCIVEPACVTLWWAKSLFGFTVSHQLHSITCCRYGSWNLTLRLEFYCLVSIDGKLLRLPA